ncbi:MAG: sigma-70 region 4 domain-containing protein, partial [Corynebacteriales bacterium]|nr:sigma-70 region 4 domain-containing protein [Mycobacteriales bacterium]
RALNVLARTGADPLANHAVDDTSEATASRVDANVDARKLAEHLARLPAKQRDVLFLHVWEQLDHAEIAAALNISLGTVRSRLSRARAAVREAHATTTTSLSARSA